MRLRDFVSQTLSDILNGIADARSSMPSGMEIVPYIHESKADSEAGFSQRQLVDFDVAVTVDSKAKGGGEVSVFSLGKIGAIGESSTSSTSRVKFRVPVILAQESDEAKNLRIEAQARKRESEKRRMEGILARSRARMDRSL